MKRFVLVMAVGLSVQFAQAQFSVPEGVISEGAQPSPPTRNVVVGDIDGDGIQDLVFSTTQQLSKVFLRKGISAFPYFSFNVRVLADRYANSILTDIDGDGDIDVFLYLLERPNGEEGFLGWKANDGFGNFGPTQSVPNEGGAGARVAIADDIDQDGDQDILYTVVLSSSEEFEQGVVWLENDGEGEFTSHVISTIGGYALGVEDIDGDDDKDLLISELFDDRIACFINNNNETLNFLASQPTIDFPSEIHVDDFNEDGNPDVVVVATSAARLIGYHENLGTNPVSFSPATIVNNASGRPSTNAHAVDFDNNGTVDIVWTSLNAQNAGWFSNDGTGEFSDAGILLTGERTYQFEPLFIDDDEFIDFVNVCRSSPRFTGIALNENGESLDPIRFDIKSIVESPVSILPFQNDLDPREEFFVVNGNADFVSVFNITGQVSAEAFTIGLQNPTSNLIRIDADDDEDSDFALSYSEGLALISKAGDTFLLSLLEGNQSVDYIEQHDLNSDGLSDIIGSSMEDNSIYVWLNSETGFSAPQAVTASLAENSRFTFTSSDSGTLSAGLIYSEIGTGNIVNLPHTGGATFGSPVILATPSFTPKIFRVGDLQGNGLTDLLVSSEGGIFKYENDDSAFLNFDGPVDFVSNISKLLLADVTGDNLPDLIALRPGQNSSVKFYENIGNGFFFLEQQTGINNLTDISFTNYNDDSRTDLVLLRSSPEEIFVSLNFYPEISGILPQGSSADETQISLQSYPNPTTGHFRLLNPEQIMDETVHLTVYSMEGKIVHELPNMSKYDEVNVAHLPVGNYALTLTGTESRNRHFLKFTKQ